MDCIYVKTSCINHCLCKSVLMTLYLIVENQNSREFGTEEKKIVKKISDLWIDAAIISLEEKILSR